MSKFTSEEKKLRHKEQCKINQRKYHAWKKIQQEFFNICLEKTQEELDKELAIKDKKKAEQEERRLSKKAEKHRLIAIEKEKEKAEKRLEKNKIKYQKNKESDKKWRENNRDKYNELVRIRQRRYLEKKKLKQIEIV